MPNLKSLLARAYPHFPVGLQNLGISAYGYVYKRERFGREFHPTLAEFEQRDRWDPARMREHIDAKLRNTLIRAFDAPFYREYWERHGVKPQHVADMSVETLSSLPVVKKEAVRQNPTAFVPDRGPRMTGLLSYFSSGSTGTPIRAICTRGAQQRFAAAREARSYRWAGTSILHPRAMIGGQPIISAGSVRPPYYRYNIAERQVYLSAYHLSRETLPDYVQGLNRHQPESITGYAFSQFQIAQLMLESGLELGFTPRASITSSEKLTERMRKAIRQAWRCRAYEEYGSVENCVLATECEAGHLHVSPDFGILEIVDNEGKPVGPGVEGRVLGTGLLNDAQLLVRYEIGDTAIWSGEPCACGRTQLPVLQEVTGRVEDVVVAPDGRELVRFHSIFIDLPRVLQGQIVQESLDEFRVRVIAEDDFGEAQVEVIRTRFRERLGPVKVVVERVAELERTKSGKVRGVISRVPPPENR